MTSIKEREVWIRSNYKYYHDHIVSCETNMGYTERRRMPKE